MGIMSNSFQGDTHCRESKTSEFSMALLLSYPYSHLSLLILVLFFSSLPPSVLTHILSFFVCTFFSPAPYSKPVVTLEPQSNLRPGDEVALTCVSYGGYPEGDVIWQDAGGRNLTENITTSVVANGEGLFTVTSVLTVVLEPNSTYSCRLINPILGEEGYISVTVTGGIYKSFLIHVGSEQANSHWFPTFFNVTSLHCIFFLFIHKYVAFLIKVLYAFVNQSMS